MTRFILWRLGSTLLFLLLASALIFFTLALAPTDAAVQMLGERASSQALLTLRHQLGLDHPMNVRYLEWLTALLRGDVGTSLMSTQSVAVLIAPAAARSALLALLAALGMLLLGGIGGIVAAIYHARWPDRLLSSFTLSGLSTPEYIVATLLILVFAVGLRWLPAVSLPPPSGHISEQWSILVLPAITLSLISGCYLLRMVRASLLRLITAPNIVSARMNGVGVAALVGRHLLPQASGSLAQMVAATVPYLFGGTVIVERIYGYPGLGELLLTAFSTRDAILLQGVAMLLAAITAMCWLIADIFVAWVDPRRMRP